MSMASEAAIAAPIASAISSLKYGKCHLSGDSTTPSSDTNSDATTFLIRTSSEYMFQPNIRQAKYPLVALLRISELRRIALPRTLVNRRKKKARDTERSPGWGGLRFAGVDPSPAVGYSLVGYGVNPLPLSSQALVSHPRAYTRNLCLLHPQRSVLAPTLGDADGA